MSAPVWLLPDVIYAVHDMQLAEHGGAAGVSNAEMLESALARPINLHAHGVTDFCRLAAAYAFGIIRNHPFVDGNKRTGFLAACIFLKINGNELNASEGEAAAAVLSLASGDSTEDDFADWLRRNVHQPSGNA